MNLLFVCGKNQWRSPTGEQVYRKDSRVHVRSAGLSSKSKHELKEKDILWANLILVMEQEQKSRIKRTYRDICPRVECLDIPDEYEFMNPELIQLLQAGTEVYIDEYSDENV